MVEVGRGRRGGAGSGGGSAAAGALTSASIAGQPPQLNQVGEHFIDFTFLDGAKLPVGGLQYVLTYPDNSTSGGILGGQIKRTGVPQGSYNIKLRGIVNAQWSVAQANVGTAVNLIVDTIGVDQGEKATLDIYVRDGNYTDHLLTTLEGQVSGDQVQASWTLKVDEKFLGLCDAKGSNKKFSRSFFFFKIKIAELSEQSGLLYYQDWIEIKAFGMDGKPAANEDYILRLATGEIIRGKLDGNGMKRINNVDPSICIVEFPNLPEVQPQ